MNDDLLRRDFTAAEPNRKWVTDLTEHSTADGKVYCCAIRDQFSNRIVGHAISDRMTADLAVTALRTALARREPDGAVIVHADRGSQFRARNVQAVLKAPGLQGSIGRVASVGDNAAIESFLGAASAQCPDHRPLAHQSRTALRRSPTGLNTPTTEEDTNENSAR